MTITDSWVTEWKPASWEFSPSLSIDQLWSWVQAANKPISETPDTSCAIFHRDVSRYKGKNGIKVQPYTLIQFRHCTKLETRTKKKIHGDHKLRS